LNSRRNWRASQQHELLALTKRRSWGAALAISCACGAALSILGNMPLMGIPGALAWMLGEPIVGAVLGRRELPFPSDSAWPFAIFVTLSWGPVVPLAWLGTRAMGLRGVARGLAFSVLMALGGAAISAGFYLLSVWPLWRDG